jgi:hypothetical protein
MIRTTQVSAAVLVFPITRRGDQVRALAAQMAARPRDQAERHLAFQLRRKFHGLRRKRIPDDTARREIRSFELAVRVELWRLVMRAPQPHNAK